LDHPVAHHRDAIAERHRLDLVVGHVTRGHAESALQCADFRADLHAQAGVEIRPEAAFSGYKLAD